MHTFLSSNYSSTMCYFPRFWGCIFCPTIHSVRSPLGSTHRSHTGSEGTEMKGWEDETSTVSMEICKRFNYGLNGKYSNIQDIQTSLGDGPWDAMGCHGMPAMGCHGMQSLWILSGFHAMLILSSNRHQVIGPVAMGDSMCVQSAPWCYARWRWRIPILGPCWPVAVYGYCCSISTS